jgi:hypothetical protein
MKHNLLLPFIMRQAGITVDDTPKIHVDEPTTADHSITFPETGFRIPMSLWGIFSYFPTFPETGFRIPMSLWGIFSYFPTSKPTATTMQESEEVYLLTPCSQFNPHDDAFAANEESTLDWEGNIVERKHRTQVLLGEIQEDESLTVSAAVSSVETRTIDLVLEAANASEERAGRSYQHIPRDADQISSILAEVSPLLDDVALYERLAARSDIGKFKASIGSTDAPSKEYLVEDDDTTATDPSTDESDYGSSEDDDNEDS